MLESVDVFHGSVSVSKALVYARLPHPREPGPWKLGGWIRGPLNACSHTLPAKMPLQDLGPGDTLLARTLIADPCPWSAESPSRYEVVIQLRYGEEVRETTKRMLGIRPLGPRGRNLLYDAKRWVLRGVQASEEPESLAWWRETGTTRILDRLDEAWLETASREGLPTMLRWDAYDKIDLDQLRRLTHFAAAIGVVLPSDVKPADGLHAAAPNLLLIQRFRAGDAVQPWAQALWVDVTTVEQFASLAASVSLPIIAARQEPFATCDAARAACDALQAALAPLGQFAGYVT